jgi:hypothetical protein
VQKVAKLCRFPPFFQAEKLICGLELRTKHMSPEMEIQNEAVERVMHAENAQELTGNKYISVSRDAEGRAVVTMTIQSAPVSVVGENGCQASDILEFAKNMFVSLNSVFPCKENSLTITKIEEAQHWQLHRTADRIKRGVEGKHVA